MSRPNIIFILSDDQGAWAAGCMGNRDLHTPNIDALAQSGCVLDNFFCVSPVCSPARASLLTGTIPSAHGVHDWLRSGNIDAERFASLDHPAYREEKKPIRYLDGQICYTDVLAANGYNCALSGKWHLGDSINPQHGFNRWYTIGMGGCDYMAADMVEHGGITIERGQYVTDLITDKALTFLDEMAQDDKPFYLSVHYTAPHSPWEAEHHPPAYIGMYEHCSFDGVPDVPEHPNCTWRGFHGTPKRREALRGYYAAITAMDANIGRIIDFVDRHGLRDNTMIIFTADNGMNMGHHGIWGKGNGTFPQNMYDTSVKVPFVISHPGVIPPGTRRAAMLSAYDVFPTILELAGCDTRVHVNLPGHSMVPALAGDDCADDAVVVYDEYGPVRMIRTQTHKYVHRYPYGPHEFYDLVNDPDEQCNLYGDTAYEASVLELRRRLEGWFVRYVDPAVDGTKEDTYGSGQLCSAGIYAEYPRKYAKNANVAEWERAYHALELPLHTKAGHEK